MPDAVARDGYFQEVASAGFWPGGDGVGGPAFYAYAYPVPQGYADAKAQPASAEFNPDLGEFVLPYATVRAAYDPDAALMDLPPDHLCRCCRPWKMGPRDPGTI